MSAKKKPRTHFYGGSESTSFRVAAVLLRKIKDMNHDKRFVLFLENVFLNLTIISCQILMIHACTYNIPINTILIMWVFERLLLSPGKCTTTYAEKMNRKRDNE